MNLTFGLDAFITVILTVSLVVAFRIVHLSHVNLGTRVLSAVQVKVTRAPTETVAFFNKLSMITGFRWTGAGEKDLPSRRRPGKKGQT